MIQIYLIGVMVMSFIYGVSGGLKESKQIIDFSTVLSALLWPVTIFVGLGDWVGRLLK